MQPVSLPLTLPQSVVSQICPLLLAHVAVYPLLLLLQPERVARALAAAATVDVAVSAEGVHKVNC